ncbi:DNA-binding GntR family transcriptional regulator [Pseudoroseicyclus aestuarii]|uniref:DNA-binding GntR family transcriptional regulator n=2 Tax=Pseudoroseicyclus aestuarii TaxID=1795041 RepID=A0A318SLN4_9RHOB|nr:DNA-binding GntR family transcriptional regulator [Pseudoroseicyclus aestuarii]
MNISTTPLKEALRQLEAEGLIEVLPRRGIVVRFDAAFAEEMILARAALEAPLAALAADRSDDETRQRLADTVKRMRAATQEADIVQLIGLNEVFHGLIHAAARSVHLTRLVASQQFYDESARRVIHRNAEESRTALDEHAAISEAIIDGNRELAATRMSAHVLRSGALYLHAVFGTTLEAPLDH